MKPTESMKADFEYFLSSHDELVKLYNGRVVVIKGQAVIGDYADELTAVKETLKTHKAGTFIVQKCTPGDADYSVTFRSRVSFA
jgi:hypothetical protein